MNKTKISIFESAIKVFSISGYDGATMDEIASEAGVAKGTLYYHFKSKEEIFKYIIEEGMKLIKIRIEEVLKREDNSILKLKALCKVQLSLVYDNRDFFKVIMSQLWGQEARQLQLRDSIQQYIDYIEEYLEEAMNDGFIKIGEKSFMAYTIFGTLCSAAVYELINEDKNNIDEVVDNLMNYILRGIEA
ncbi:TetR/AcrR family transcriptional regulator [Clostridium lundense]|uniref:TetR/AcrR family transcriptional regulator n=1 Tax=Clostridium lundense TaxID=319475 RepID=UPI000482D9B7|nr:TetR/AcrR family transcriptional regulator [Clostridium lundense]